MTTPSKLSRRAFLALLVLAASGTTRSVAAREDVPKRVTLDVFVNRDYHHRQKLVGWKATADVIAFTLREWYPKAEVHARIENGSPEELQSFLEALPGKTDCDLSVVYLGSHQSHEGVWDFTSRARRSWSEILQNANLPSHPRRLTILDSCFAAAARRHQPWVNKMGLLCLYASASSEWAWEMNFRNRLPIDFKRRYPATSVFLDHALGRDWNGQLSFLGFVWTEAYLHESRPPADRAELVAFLERCATTAAEFRRKTSKRLASEVQVTASENQ